MITTLQFNTIYERSFPSFTDYEQKLIQNSIVL